MNLPTLLLNADSLHKWVALAMPLVLIISMYCSFQVSSKRFEYPLGYLLGFVVYWLFWCILIPMALLGGVRPLLGLFQPFPALQELSWKTHLLLWWPILFPLFFVFLPRIMKANANILIVSVLLGIVIGFTEEILWRGVYMHLFPNNICLNLIYPSLMFALWHLAPLSVAASRMPGGLLSFVAYALLPGISYALTVRQTKSIA